MEIVFRWACGFFVSLAIGHFIVPFLMEKIRNYMQSPATDVEKRNSKLAFNQGKIMGALERIIFTIAVGVNLPNTFVGMGIWLGLKMATGWQRRPMPDDHIEQILVIRYSQTALIGGVLSLSIATVGGLVANGTLWI